MRHDSSTTEVGLRLPGEWIERRLELTDPEVSLRSIAALEARRSAIPEEEDFVILPPQPLAVSFTPQRLQDIAQRNGLSMHGLIDEVVADLKDGLAIDSTSWTTNDGSKKFQIWGARWKLVTRSKQAKNSWQQLAVLESVTRIDIPTNRLRLSPHAVRFTEIWNEQACDLGELVRAYSNCRAEIQANRQQRRDLGRQIRELGGHRRVSKRRVLQELSRARPDSDVRTLSQLHGVVRRHYSALRVMMDLLRLRAENEQHEFAATVQAFDDGAAENADDRTVEDPMLQLVLAQPGPTGVLEEDALVEIVSGTCNRRPTRARIRKLAQHDNGFALEVDLPPDGFSPGDTVHVRTVSRFGMQAQLNERVEGSWPSLARLLCEAGTLAPAPSVLVPTLFNEKLNDHQRTAVRGALATPHAFCIQGPPGTGKTTVSCEIIQQLAAKGERVLMVAPTHVAIDEVLRRIGSREGVRALRLSWDDAKVADDVRKFTPANLIDPFLERARKPDLARRSRWNAERDAIGDAIARLLRLRETQEQHAGASARQYEAEARVVETRTLLASEEPGLRATLSECSHQMLAVTAEIGCLREASGQAESMATTLRAQAKWTARFVGWLGFGEIGKARREQLRFVKSLARKEQEQSSLQARELEAQDRLKIIQEQLAQAEQWLQDADNRLQETDRDRLAAEASCRDHPLIGTRDLHAASITRLISELRDRDERLGGYQRLAPRFDELVASATEGGQNVSGLRRDLLAVTNLFCCTTTGVAGSLELRDLVFDTLIVDEASRVTDSEFLIGAVRARRWILVGDEHQLPPYVEQQDEHFIHALSALHRSETCDQVLGQAVDELGALWEEDEELHRFRRDSVLRLAQQLLDGGQWESCYRAAFQSGIDHLRQEVENPSRALLRAMRDNLVRSLFERVVQLCPAELKSRLIEQRRMIEPIAAIVSDPVYGGEYRTPPADDLAEHGVTPMTTATFPTPVTFLDTSLLGIKARDELVRNSFVNPVEATWTVRACCVLDRELAQAGDDPVTVSILAFYKAQARLIRERLGEHRFARLRFSVVDAIDRIQGQESDVVFLSFCRTSGKHVPPTFGQWLQDIRRLNVACTRAHRALVFVGQKELHGRLCSNERAKEFYRHLNHLFETRTASMRVVRQFGGSEQ